MINQLKVNTLFNTRNNVKSNCDNAKTRNLTNKKLSFGTSSQTLFKMKPNNVAEVASERIAEYLEKQGMDIWTTGAVRKTLDKLESWPENLDVKGPCPIDGILALLQPKGLKAGTSVYTDNTFERRVIRGTGKDMKEAVRNLLNFAGNAGEFLNLVLDRATKHEFRIELPSDTKNIIEALKNKGFKTKNFELRTLSNASKGSTNVTALRLDHPFLEHVGIPVYNPKDGHFSDLMADNEKTLNKSLKEWIHNEGLTLQLNPCPSETNSIKGLNPLVILSAIPSGNATERFI